MDPVDPITIPDLPMDTSADTDVRNELTEALDWLRRAGIVTGERPAFAGFFDEVVNSSESYDISLTSGEGESFS